jgi:hypothetical protein
MDKIEIKWHNEGDKKYLIADGIECRIEIDVINKEVKNAKKFFREIIYLSFLNNWNKKIELIEDFENEIQEVKTLINDLVDVCNYELHAHSNTDSLVD